MVDHAKAQEVIDFLRALEAAEVQMVSDLGRELRHVSPEQGDEIAAFVAARGGFDLFIELDERPGQFDAAYGGSDWHWKLRQARNDKRNCFFERLNGR